MTHGTLASQKLASEMWDGYCRSQNTWDGNLARAAVAFLNSKDIAEEPVRFLAEIQVQYEPYVKLGRRKTHLHYKVARARTAPLLQRDCAIGFRNDGLDDLGDGGADKSAHEKFAETEKAYRKSWLESEC